MILSLILPTLESKNMPTLKDINYYNKNIIDLFDYVDRHFPNRTDLIRTDISFIQSLIVAGEQFTALEVIYDNISDNYQIELPPELKGVLLEACDYFGLRLPSYETQNEDLSRD